MYSKDDFKKYVPMEILEPASFRFYCQFFVAVRRWDGLDEKERLLYEKEIFDRIQ